MDISGLLRTEVERRGLTVTSVAEGADVPFSTVSEFLRGEREIGADKASRIAEFLGFDLTLSRLRRKAMAEHAALVDDLEKRGVSLDDESIEQVRDFAESLRCIEERYQAWSEDDAEQASKFRADIEWLEEHGWEAWSEDDASDVAEFASNLKTLEEIGEDPTEERMAEVAEFLENLRKQDEA
jgi:transcriptional regulator with XRE-family HTH domain